MSSIKKTKYRVFNMNVRKEIQYVKELYGENPETLLEKN